FTYTTLFRSSRKWQKASRRLGDFRRVGRRREVGQIPEGERDVGDGVVHRRERSEQRRNQPREREALHYVARERREGESDRDRDGEHEQHDAEQLDRLRKIGVDEYCRQADQGEQGREGVDYL